MTGVSIVKWLYNLRAGIDFIFNGIVCIVMSIYFLVIYILLHIAIVCTICAHINGLLQLAMFALYIIYTI